MNALDRELQNAKMLVLFKLGVITKLSRENVQSLANDWLKKHPEMSWNNLLELLQTRRVIYKQKTLYDVPELDKKEIDFLVYQMREENGVKIKNRWYHARLYKKCFIGYEAVEWLMNNRKICKEEALRLGQILIEAKVFHHVHDEHDFYDDYLFYRFYLDE